MFIKKPSILFLGDSTSYYYDQNELLSEFTSPIAQFKINESSITFDNPIGKFYFDKNKYRLTAERISWNEPKRQFLAQNNVLLTSSGVSLKGQEFIVDVNTKKLFFKKKAQLIFLRS